MDELLLWLRATIEGDQRLAEVSGGVGWVIELVDDHPENARPEDLLIRDSRGCVVVFHHTYDGGGVGSVNDAEHMATHDPRDTIARCEADLAILDEHAPVHAWRPFSARPGRGEHVGCKKCVRWIEGHIPEREAFPCRTVRLLAQGYRHRPGWKEAWRPE